MPYATDISALNLKVRSLLYGRGKTQKTWWTLLCAKLGYNVVLLDGDTGAHIVAQIEPEFRKKILVIDVNDTQEEAVFAKFMTMFCKPGSDFFWNETTKRPAPGVKVPECAYVHIRPSKLTTNDVLILDSWTQLAASMRFQFALENHIDMTDAKKVEWDGYGFEGRFLDYVLNHLHGLPCHLLVVGHEGKHEKRSKDGKTVLSSDIVPISSSGPHGSKLAKHFSDVLYFERFDERTVRIKVSGDHNRDGGSRLLPPSTKTWAEMGPKILFDVVGSKPTGAPCEGAVWYASGSNIGKQVSGNGASNSSAAPAPQPPANSAPVLEVKKSSLFARLGATKEAPMK